MCHGALAPLVVYPRAGALLSEHGTVICASDSSRFVDVDADVLGLQVGLHAGGQRPCCSPSPDPHANGLAEERIAIGAFWVPALRPRSCAAVAWERSRGGMPVQLVWQQDSAKPWSKRMDHHWYCYTGGGQGGALHAVPPRRCGDKPILG